MPATVADSFAAALALLQSWGFDARTYDSSWRTRRARSDIAYAPSAIIDHHTGDVHTPDRMLFVTGRTGLPGPLAQWSVHSDGQIVLGAAGYGNGVGMNNRAALAQVIAGPPLDAEIRPGPDTPDFSGNRRTITVECESVDAYSPAQRAAVVALDAALVKAFGWSQARPPVAAHKEITRRKPGDPGDDMAELRREVVAMLAEKASVPVPPVVPEFVLLDGNMQLPWGSKDIAGRVDLIAAQNPDVITLQESTEDLRDALCKRLGMKTYVQGTQAVLWRTSKATARSPKRKAFRVKNGVVTNGAIKVPLLFGGVGIDVTSVHIRAKSTGATDAQQVADMRAVLAIGGKWPQLVAGDFNDPNPDAVLVPTLQRLTPKQQTHDDGGAIDAVFGRGVTVTGQRLVNPGGLSDHRWLVVTFTIGTPVPTN